ncbi:MAG: DUF1615 domain-containing protein [Steroidobacteraceae bacterium]
MQARFLPACVAACGLLLASCTSPPPRSGSARPTPEDVRASIAALLPQAVRNRAEWAADIRDSFAALRIAPTREHLCAVVAVIDQESGFRVDPVIPELGRRAWREIDERAANANVPRVLVHAALDLESSDGRTYAARISAARTEKQLSDTYEDFVGQVPLGRRLFSGWNPIRTRGPMQVNGAFAERFERLAPYPFATHGSIRDELFTRRASLYFGIAHLLGYQAPYDRYLFRFADYNAGQYASRNAAFQRAAAIAAHEPLRPDGALLPAASGGLLAREGALLAGNRAASDVGTTERVLDRLARRLQLSPAEIHAALEQGTTRAFEQSALYRRVFALADRESGRRQPRASVPQIRLHGPKIERALTTDWYAHRVNGRFERCMRE